MAHKKGGGTTRNGRDSEAKRLGVKVYGGQTINAGGIIIRQRGTPVRAGEGVGTGKDHTLFALIASNAATPAIKPNAIRGSSLKPASSALNFSVRCCKCAIN